MHIVRFKAGFANQLFQYCFYLHLQEQYGEDNVYADKTFLELSNEHHGYRLESCQDIRYWNNIKDLEYLRITDETINSISIEEGKNYLYDGYWQNTKYVENYIDKVRKTVEREADTPSINSLAMSIKQHNTVSVHVRRGDYINHFVHGNIANKCFYQNAIAYAEEKLESPFYYVFSDDMQWVKSNLSFPVERTTFVEGNSTREWNDLYLMSICRHHILANSSFSWWAHALHQTEQMVSIIPEYWFNEKTKMDEPDFFGKVVKLPNTPKYVENLKAPYFSILIPAYNKEREIRRCLSSILNQTYENIEVILVDDGSSDGTKDVVESYTRRDTRFKYIKSEENQSLLASRMRGMDEATGKYILLVDADDYLDENACQVLFDELEKIPSDILEFQFVREPSKEMGPWPAEMPKDIAAATIQNNYNYNVWHRCYSNEIIKQLRKKTTPFYCNMAEDGYFTVTLMVLARSYRRIPDVLYHYVVGSGMSTNDYQDVQQVTAAVTSMQNKTKQLVLFLEKERTDLLPYVDAFFRNDLKKVVQLCTKDTVPFDKQIILLRHLDTLCNSNYEDEWTSFLLEASNAKLLYDEANIRGKAKLLCKAFGKDVIKGFIKKITRNR